MKTILMTVITGLVVGMITTKSLFNDVLGVDINGDPSSYVEHWAYCYFDEKCSLDCESIRLEIELFGYIPQEEELQIEDIHLFELDEDLIYSNND